MENLGWLLLGLVLGLLMYIVFVTIRILRGSHNDSSNVMNALAIISHPWEHADEYLDYIIMTDDIKDVLDDLGVDYYKPFWYLEHDEFDTVRNPRLRK